VRQVDQAAGAAEHLGEPISRMATEPKGVTGVVPDNDLGLDSCSRADGKIEGRHVRCLDDELLILEGGTNQGQPRMGTLSQKASCLIDYHPSTVVLQAEAV